MTASVETIEFATIRLAPGVTEDALIAASDGFQKAFLAEQPGFISRALVKNDDGTFADVVRWRSHEDALAVAEKIMTSEACQGYFAVMDMSADSGDGMSGVSHHAVLRTY